MMENALGDIQKLENQFLAESTTEQIHQARHLEKYGHMFARDLHLEESDIRELITKIERNGDAKAAEKLMYAYWNNHMGIPIDLDKSHYYALRAYKLGSARGAITASIFEYFRSKDDDEESLIKLYQNDSFLSELDEFTTIFEAYRKSDFYIK